MMSKESFCRGRAGFTTRKKNESMTDDFFFFFWIFRNIVMGNEN